jgi:small subunit ribosomal protein S8
MTIDRISNMLSSLRNAVKAEKPYMEFIHTKECESILKVLKTKGFVKEVKSFKPEGKPYKMLRVDFSYEIGSTVLDEIKQISKPGRRAYAPYSELKKIAGGYGVQIVSTNRGVMTSEEARKRKLGGEVICEVR